MTSYNEAEMLRSARALADWVIEEQQRAARLLTRATTGPLGSAPGAAKDTGELRGSLRIQLNGYSSEEPAPRTFYPILGDAETDAVTAGMKLGDWVGYRWIADHAAVIEDGRKVKSNGVLGGSIQNPEGFVGPAANEVAVRMES